MLRKDAFIQCQPYSSCAATNLWLHKSEFGVCVKFWCFSLHIVQIIFYSKHFILISYQMLSYWRSQYEERNFAYCCFHVISGNQKIHQRCFWENKKNKGQVWHQWQWHNRGKYFQWGNYVVILHLHKLFLLQLFHFLFSHEFCISWIGLHQHNWRSF